MRHLGQAGASKELSNMYTKHIYKTYIHNRLR